MNITQIAREAGTEPSTVRRLIEGQKSVLTVNAEKILSVPLDVRVSRGDVPAIGAIRRVRALYALGHLNWVIAQEAGVSRDAICSLAAGSWQTLEVSRDAGIRAAYDRLSMRTGTSWKTRKTAARHGWVPPLAWDDDTIDDPSAQPQTDALAPTQSEGGNLVDRWLMGESVILGRAERHQVLVHLFEWSELPPEEIARRLDMSASAAARAWERHKDRARKAGSPVPWRRRWMLRNKELVKNEMGAAA
ncbi:hypothetical protein ABZ383_27455 [Streptomyces sp. NPDC005900]|uniref:hypothetical protein n=1 Tax=Streptomyces sp. NPDC005900 TaxID=3154569 RepID=UPI0034061E53